MSEICTYISNSKNRNIDRSVHVSHTVPRNQVNPTAEKCVRVAVAIIVMRVCVCVRIILLLIYSGQWTMIIIIEYGF